MLEAGRILGCEQFQLSEEASILISGLAAVPAAQRVPGPMPRARRPCFAGVCSDEAGDSSASELCL